MAIKVSKRKQPKKQNEFIYSTNGSPSGIFSDKECYIAEHYASMVGRDILEVGSYLGKSTFFLCQGSQYNGANVYAVDMWDDEDKPSQKRNPKFNKPSIYRRFRDNMACFSNIVPIKGRSEVVGLTWDKPLGLLHIDGDHDYESVLSDFTLFTPHIVSGGYLLMHDYILSGNKHYAKFGKLCEGVARVAREKIINSDEWGYLDVVDRLLIARKK